MLCLRHGGEAQRVGSDKTGGFGQWLVAVIGDGLLKASTQVETAIGEGALFTGESLVPFLLLTNPRRFCTKQTLPADRGARLMRTK